MTLRIYCPTCSNEVRTTTGICPSCGAPLDEAATQRLDTPRPLRSDPGPRSYDSIDDARFVPGTILAERYRIFGLLGKGGMGEVYRADDLKLSQPVALKFLPERLLRDGASLARFHREVRVARQVSHKNVCRVYDIGETNGHHFLSMEYIKGEELSSLLRRIGRLPSDKALQIARQICAGLAAAHDTGVLHRDLKPSNIMIDGDGNARVLDFGLAGLAEEFRDDEISSGTPAYMAPEQLEGRDVTVRSDIYSLGLVFYELFTGRRAFEAGSLHELIRLRRSDTTPTSPTSLVKDLDPVVESVIERCIQKQPQDRPSSALQVAAALPGGDPIAAALAAGETPSPEMIAAAPKKGTLRPVVALGLLAATIVFLVLATLLSTYVATHRWIPLEKPPEVLKQQASDIAKKFGYNERPADVAYSFGADINYYRYQIQNRATLQPWSLLKHTQPGLVHFWYRQGPTLLVPYNTQTVSMSDPPLTTSGMIRMRLDTDGKLSYFEAVPAALSAANTGGQAPNWPQVFETAGLDIQQFTPANSEWTPPLPYDSRQAWAGVYPSLPDMPIRVEAASYAGRPVYFQIVSPWSVPVAAPRADDSADRIFTWLLLGIFFAILAGSLFLALKNLRLGRGDRRGAFRVALFLFVVRMAYWAVSTHHVADSSELMLLITGLQSALFWSCFVGLLYIALEPYLRKRWPQRIISWNRLLAGDFRDPMVGRDILAGAALGALCVMLMYLRSLVPRWAGVDPGMPDVNDALSTQLTGVATFAKLFLNQITAALVQSFMFVFLILFLSLLLRKDWLGIIAGALIIESLFVASVVGQEHPISIAIVVINVGLFIFSATRLGPLAMMSTLLVFHLWVFFPITTQVTAWYAMAFNLDVIVLLALALYAYYISLGGQSPTHIKLLAED